MLLGNNTVFQIGKEGVGYLLNESNLGGIGGQEFSLQVCNSAFGGTAFVSPVIYVPCTNGLFALKVSDESSSPSFSFLWNATGFDAGAPIVAGGAAWTIDQNTGVLRALNLISGSQVFNYTLGSVVHFETPSAAGGLIFAAGDDSIYAFAI